MQIEVRYSWQGATSQQHLAVKEIELTDMELATIYGGQAPAGRPVVQQQIQQQVVPPTTPSQQQQQQTPTADTLIPWLETNGITTIIGVDR